MPTRDKCYTDRLQMQATELEEARLKE